MTFLSSTFSLQAVSIGESSMKVLRCTGLKLLGNFSPDKLIHYGDFISHTTHSYWYSAATLTVCVSPGQWDSGGPVCLTPHLRLSWYSSSSCSAAGSMCRIPALFPSLQYCSTLSPSSHPHHSHAQVLITGYGNRILRVEWRQWLGSVECLLIGLPLVAQDEVCISAGDWKPFPLAQCCTGAWWCLKIVHPSVHQTTPSRHTGGGSTCSSLTLLFAHLRCAADLQCCSELLPAVALSFIPCHLLSD